MKTKEEHRWKWVFPLLPLGVYDSDGDYKVWLEWVYVQWNIFANKHYAEHPFNHERYKRVAK